MPGEDRSAVATSSDGACRQVAEEVCGSRFSTVLAWIGRPIQPGEGFLCWRFTL